MEFLERHQHLLPIPTFINGVYMVSNVSMFPMLLANIRHARFPMYAGSHDCTLITTNAFYLIDLFALTPRNCFNRHRVPIVHCIWTRLSYDNTLWINPPTAHSFDLHNNKYNIIYERTYFQNYNII